MPTSAPIERSRSVIMFANDSPYCFWKLGRTGTPIYIILGQFDLIVVSGEKKGLTFLGRTRLDIKRSPYFRESILWVQGLVDRNGFIELFLTNITPGTYWVADYFDIEVGHYGGGEL